LQAESVADDGHSAFAFVNREVDSLLLQYAKARLDSVPRNPQFEVVELNPPVLENFAGRAAGILKNPLLREIQEIFFVRALASG
jgi:hypothetical protein